MPVLAALDLSTPTIIGASAGGFIFTTRRIARNWHEYEGERDDSRNTPPPP